MSDKQITVTISVSGDNRAIAGDLVLSHLAKALAGMAITGHSVVTMASDGSVKIDGITTYKPQPARTGKPSHKPNPRRLDREYSEY